MTPRRLIGKMLFSMTYGTEAVIPVEVSLSSSRVAGFTHGHNDECMVGNLDALEERRDMVSMQLADYQQKLAKGYNGKVKPRDFVLNDLIL